MTPWSSGSCSGVTMWACMPNRAILSENQYWTEQQRCRDRDDQVDRESEGREHAPRPTKRMTSSRPVRNIRAVRP